MAWRPGLMNMGFPHEGKDSYTLLFVDREGTERAGASEGEPSGRRARLPDFVRPVCEPVGRERSEGRVGPSEVDRVSPLITAAGSSPCRSLERHREPEPLLTAHQL